MKVLISNYADLFFTIDEAVKKRRLTPSLVLIYSAIDCLAHIEMPNASVKDAYVHWLDKWVLPAEGIDCDAIDIYAARCAWVHTLTPFSKMSEDGRSVPIYYSWGSACHRDLKKCVDILGDNAKTLHLESLSRAVKLGCGKFFESALHDRDLRNRLKDASGRYMTHLSSEEMALLLALDKS